MHRGSETVAHRASQRCHTCLAE